MALTAVSAKQAAFVARKLLMRSGYDDIYGNMGQAPLPRKDGIPMHASLTITYRRYEALSTTVQVLVEGETPDAEAGTYTDITCTLQQYGNYVILSDISVDTVEDPVLSIFGDLLGEQAMSWINQIREGVLVAGSNRVFANGTQRSDVNTLLTATLINKATRSLGISKARKLTKVLTASAGVATSPIPASYIGVCNSYTRYDLEQTIGATNGFVPAEKYSQQGGLLPGEFGKVGQVRFKENPDMADFPNEGAAHGVGHKTTDDTSEDVSVTLIFGEEAYGLVPFSGYGKTDGVKTYVKPASSGGTNDPLEQRNTVGMKFMQNAKRLNENWMIRIEHGVTA